jgi:HD superfamily phosphohydrolase
MLRRASERLLEDADASVTAADLRRMDDHDLAGALRASTAAETFARRLYERDLYKRAVWAELPDVPDEVLDADHEQLRRYERMIADEADVSRDAVIVDVPDRPTMRESSSRVVVGGEIRRLGEQSPLVGALRTAQHNQWRLGVYAPAERVDTVGRAAATVLGLDVEGALVTDRPGTHATLEDFLPES